MYVTNCSTKKKTNKIKQIPGCVKVQQVVFLVKSEVRRNQNSFTADTYAFQVVKSREDLNEEMMGRSHHWSPCIISISTTKMLLRTLGHYFFIQVKLNFVHCKKGKKANNTITHNCFKKCCNCKQCHGYINIKPVSFGLVNVLLRFYT